jgi:hypothetical protein
VSVSTIPARAGADDEPSRVLPRKDSLFEALQTHGITSIEEVAMKCQRRSKWLWISVVAIMLMLFGPATLVATSGGDENDDSVWKTLQDCSEEPGNEVPRSEEHTSELQSLPPGMVPSSDSPAGHGFPGRRVLRSNSGCIRSL